MIAVVKRPDGRTAFVALHLCPLSLPAKRWRPIRAEGDVNEDSAIDAARLCVAALRAVLGPLVGLSLALHRDCCEVEPAAARLDTEAHARRIAMSLTLSRELVRAWGNLRRLLDEPTEDDNVTLEVAAAPLLDGPTEHTDDDERAHERADAPTLTAHQLRAGRVLAGLGIRDMAIAAGISATAVSLIERGHTKAPQQTTQEALKTALEKRGIEFAPGGWVRHVGDALAGQTMPSSCLRCAQARYLLDITNRLIGQTRAILHESGGSL